MNLFDYLFAAIPLLGTLIFVHELGHFLAARACGVRVLKFSLGFGSPIGFGSFRMRWVRSGTEYVVAWFPLGGFVKMLGEPMPGAEPEPAVLDARPDEYLSAKNTWQKLLITFAGPAMNLALPVFAFMLVLWIGVPRATNVVGMVERGSPAAVAGVRAGDRLIAVDGVPVSWWYQAREAIAESGGDAIRLDVERAGEKQRFEVPLERRGILDPFGGVERIGWIGLGSRRLPTLLGVPAGASLAARAGLRSGDRVNRVNDVPVEDWDALRKAYAALPVGSAVAFSVVREPVSEGSGDAPAVAETVEPVSTVVSATVAASLDAFGVIPATILASVVAPGMPAAEAGLEPGDLILAVDGRPVGSFESFANSVRTSGGRALEITYARDGTTRSVSVAPRLREVEGPLEIEGMTEEIYQIGIGHALATLPGASALDQVRNPLTSLPRALDMTVDMTVVFLRGLGKLVSGEVGTDKLAGPIGIAEIARKSLDLGWQAYLSTMMLISINLGILNLLPIPILDGGQALIYIVEGVKRSPISVRTRDAVQQAGLLMIVMLMALAFWNDLSRNWAQFVEWIGSAL